MFLIFKIFPQWFWWLLLIGGVLGFFSSYLPQVKAYDFIIKSFTGTLIAATIFIFGMLQGDNTWKAAAAELQAKVAEVSQQSQAANETIKQKTITKIQVVKVRGAEVTKYIDREVSKSNGACVIPETFVTAHNRAAEVPK